MLTASIIYVIQTSKNQGSFINQNLHPILNSMLNQNLQNSQPDDSWLQLETQEFPKNTKINNIYYVDQKTGNDQNNGKSEKQAFKTIKKANETIIFGDTVYVKNGTYEEDITISASGTLTSWITFQAFPGHKPVVIGTQDGTFRVEGNYIKIIGFKITSTKIGSGIFVNNGNHHTQIINNEIHDSGCGGISGMRTDYLYIEGNIVYRNAFRSPYQCSGISVYQAQAVDNKPGFHIIIRGNISYSNQNKLPVKDGKVTDGNGIIIDDFRHTQFNSQIPAYQNWTLIENNIIFDNGGRGIHVFHSDYVLIRNNTAFANLKSTNLEGTLNGEISTLFSSHIQVYNNIAYTKDRNKKTFIDDYSQGNKWDYNLSYNGDYIINGGHSDVVLGKHNLINIDPQFISPSISPETADFRLKPNSPAIDSGNVINGAKIDFNHQKRPINLKSDIGAYEFVK